MPDPVEHSLRDVRVAGAQVDRAGAVPAGAGGGTDDAFNWPVVALTYVDCARCPPAGYARYGDTHG